MSDIDTAAADSLKVLDPERPIREADVRKTDAPKTEVRKTEVRKTEAPKTEVRRMQSTQGQPIRRLGLDTLLDKIADWASVIPFFRLFTIVIGMNPINQAPVERSGANIIRAGVELLGGGLIVKALDTYGIFEKAGAWLEKQIDTLGMVGSSIFHVPAQVVDATQALNRSAGVANPRVLRGRSLSCRATLLSWACE